MLLNNIVVVDDITREGPFGPVFSSFSCDEYDTFESNVFHWFSGFRLLKNLLPRPVKRTSAPVTIIRCLHLMRSTSTPWTMVRLLAHSSLKDGTSVNLNPNWILENLDGQTVPQILRNLLTKSLRSLLLALPVQSRNLAKRGRPPLIRSLHPPRPNPAQFCSSAPPPRTSSKPRRVREQIQITVLSSRCGSCS